jgi:hypothetical protein
MHRWEDNIKMYFKEIVYGQISSGSGYEPVEGFLAHDNILIS